MTTDPYAQVDWGTLTVSLHTPDGQVAFACTDVRAPLAWSELAIATVAMRYFGRRPDGSPERSVRQMIERVTRTLGGWAAASGHVSSEHDRALLEAQLAQLVLAQRGTFATPVWLNVGLEPRPFTSACFILETNDSIGALLDWNAREGLIFQQGGGAGINLSQVRSSREPVSRGGLASGPVSFMRAADAWAATIRSGGRARRGAKMVVLDSDHPDVLDFIACKSREEERGAALVRAGYEPEEAVRSLAFQHATHAVRVSDAFMDAAAAGGEWQLRAVTTGEVLDTLPARDLLRACAQAAWRCGDPGLQFASTIARWHTCPHSGPITASNPCGEFLHVGESACNLATLNLLAFLDEPAGGGAGGGRGAGGGGDAGGGGGAGGGEGAGVGRDGGGGEGCAFDVDRFVRSVELLVSAQDAIVDGSDYPTERIAQSARRFRQIGLGYSNLAALLLRCGIAYDSPQGRAWAAAISALMTAAAYRRSAELARTLGPFAEFELNREPMLAVLERHRDATDRIGRISSPGQEAPREILAAARQAWAQALAGAEQHGLRNAQTTLLAPTGTVSLMLDCESTGIEPYYAFAGFKRFADGGQMHFESRVLADGLQTLGYSTHAIEQLCEYAADHGHLTGAPALRPGDDRVVQTASAPDPVSPAGHLGMVAAVQPLLSGGVSKTLNLPHETTVDEVEQIFFDAWRMGLKAIAVYRDASKIGQPLLAASDTD